MAWFSLRVIEVPGSTPGQARLWVLLVKTIWKLSNFPWIMYGSCITIRCVIHMYSFPCSSRALNLRVFSYRPRVGFFQWKLSCILVMKIFPIENSPYASERQEMAEHGRWNVFCKSKSISMHLTFFSVSSRISYCPWGGGGGRGREYLRIIWFLGRAEGGLERLYSGLWFLVKCVSPHFVSFMCFRNDPNEQILLS